MIYKMLADRIRNNKPVVLLTVIDGPNIGATLLATPSLANLGTLGDPELDRVAARDANTARSLTAKKGIENHDHLQRYKHKN